MSRRCRKNFNEPKERNRLLFIGRCEKEVIIEPPSSAHACELVVSDDERHNAISAEANLSSAKSVDSVRVGRVELHHDQGAIRREVDAYAKLIFQDTEYDDLVDALEDLNIYAFRFHQSPSGKALSKSLSAYQQPKTEVSKEAKTPHWRLQALMGLSQSKTQLQIYFEALNRLGHKKRPSERSGLKIPFLIDKHLAARIEERFDGTLASSIKSLLESYFKTRTTK